jgi:uncharacterized protein
MTNLETKLRELITTASKSHDVLSRDVLKVLLGEIQLKDAATEEAQHDIVRKLIKSNQTSIDEMAKQTESKEGWEDNKNKLVMEIAILQPLLPKTWSEDEIKDFIIKHGVDVKSVDNQGKAIGIAMKSLKAENAPVDPATVRKVVEELRR